MPILRVGSQFEENLIRAPESGMGFQIVSLSQEIFVVLNATVIIPLDELRERRFSEEDYAVLSGNPDSDQIRNLEAMQTMGFSIVFSKLDREFQRRDLIQRFGLNFNEATATPPANIISPKLPYAYYRFSPYYHDKRVDPKTGDFLPGTYATTYNDLHMVPSGYAAVGRYALPNPASARFVFQIVTFDRPTLMGTATPNFGQAGGGVEALFQNGAKNRPGISFGISAG